LLASPCELVGAARVVLADQATDAFGVCRRQGFLSHSCIEEIGQSMSEQESAKVIVFGEAEGVTTEQYLAEWRYFQ
jgi:hypothetical protein